MGGVDMEMSVEDVHYLLGRLDNHSPRGLTEKLHEAAGEWSTDYSGLQRGDFFVVDGDPKEYYAVDVVRINGTGVGMGEVPDTWKVVTGHGTVTYDPWTPKECYRRYKVTRKLVSDSSLCIKQDGS